MRWLVIELPDPKTTDDIEYETEEPGDYDKGWVDGYNAALKDVEHRLTGGGGKW